MTRVDDILKEVDYMKSIIKDRHIRYLQPDMDCNVNIVVDCFAKNE